VVIFVTSLRAFGFPSCQLTLRCFWVPIFPTHIVLHSGAHLSNSPCVTFRHPSCQLAPHCVWAPILPTYLALCLSAHIVTDLRAFGCPYCQFSLCCVWAPFLPSHLAFPLVTQPWLGYIKKSTSKIKLVLIRPPAHLFS
jgi:hypothetical protein